MKRFAVRVAFALLLLGTLSTRCGSALSARDNEGVFWTEGQPPPGAEGARVPEMPSLAPLVDTVSPAVVNIFTTKVVDAKRREWFHKNHPQGDDPERLLANSLGSGFVITADGYIVTGNHVVADATDIRVRFVDGTVLPAKLVGRDPATDLGLIKVSSRSDLPHVSLGDSSKSRPGDWVIVIGNPFGYVNTVSVGIISGKSRRAGVVRLEDFIQTDASINPGNSGGPLFNLRGEVIGVSSAIVEDANGIGFAVPINLAKEVLPDLKTHGRPIRGLLGVRVQRVTPDLARSLGLKGQAGALVADVVRGSPADRAEIRPGDVITTFDGVEIGDMEQLPRFVARTRPGTKAEVVWIRDGRTMSAKVRVAEYQEPGATAQTERPPAGAERYGFQVGDLNDRRRGELGVDPRTLGVVVLSVERGSVAEKAGLRPGDVVQEVNRRAVTSPAQLAGALEGAPKRRPILLLVEREGASVFIPLGK